MDYFTLSHVITNLHNVSLNTYLSKIIQILSEHLYRYGDQNYVFGVLCLLNYHTKSAFLPIATKTLCVVTSC